MSRRAVGAQEPMLDAPFGAVEGEGRTYGILAVQRCNGFWHAGQDTAARFGA